WFAFVFVLTSRRHQGLHDLASRSVVVHRDATALPPHEALPERQMEERTFIYPPLWRRAIVILGYCVLTFILAEFLTVLLISPSCLFSRRCGDADRILLFVL